MDADPATAGMSSLLIQAAHSAAQADGLAPPSASDLNGAVAAVQARAAAAAVAAAASSPLHSGGGGGGKKKGPPLRRGKWTAEEEAYANRLIQEFKAGLLPLTDGTTLRTFLSKLLNCDPMRISKKFVGSNCIGKQVFRRRNADMNRLTPEQIQQSRAELSELERRFLERVAQTNRVKSTGVGASNGACGAPNGVGAATTAASATGPILNALGGSSMAGNLKEDGDPPSPPWLAPPLGYKPGNGAAFAAANLANSRAAAAGRALLNGGILSQASSNSLNEAFERKAAEAAAAAAAAAATQISPNPWHGSAGLLAMAEMQQRASQQNLVNALGSQSNFFRSGSNAGFSSQTLSQLQQNASAARLADLTSNSSMNSLMLKTGLSREQLSQLTRDQGLSSSSLSNMMQRQNSFDALMSLNFQSLQSIDNLANLMQTGAAAVSQVPETGLKNADFGLSSVASPSSRHAGAGGALRTSLGGSGAATNDDYSAARRLASAGRMESLLKSLSSNNVRGGARGVGNGNGLEGGVSASSANLSSLLQSIQGAGGGGGNLSTASLLGAGGQSAVSLANLLRQDSSTGLTALRLQDGLNQRNSSVDDFLSLVAAGDIPHQDPSLLNVPLLQQQGGGSSQDAAAKLLAQSQMLQQAQEAIASRSFSNLSGSQSQLSLLMQQQLQQQQSIKRKLDELGDDPSLQGPPKR